VEREGSLDADAERLLADGERLAHAGTLPLDDDALEDLDATALAFYDLEVHAHRVARLELRQVGSQLPLLEKFDRIRHGDEARAGLGGMLAHLRYRKPMRFGGQ
jgi:hypothetical protein